MRVTQDNEILSKAEEAFEIGDFSLARQLLQPLLEKKNGKAIRLNCSHFDADIDEEEMDRIYVDGMFEASENGDLEALYIVGSFYDIGEYVTLDKEKASKIFKEAADRGHAHSMWIHAVDLLYGEGAFKQSSEQGINYLNKAIKNGSAEACITKAGFLLQGEFGFEINKNEANKLRQLAKEFDDTTYDPYE